MQLELDVKRLIDRYIATNHSIVAGVSGGVDSMVLLYCLRQLAERVDRLSSLLIVHVHHGLRETADRDAEFVHDYCQKSGIPVRIERVHVPTEQGIGLEAAARDVRYKALVSAAKACSNAVIALAHHEDDQIETFMLRWLRGTGLHGLGSMRRVGEREGVPLLRPLLHTSRGAIEEFARAHDIPHIEDESNQDDRYVRNYLRHQVIPKLRSVQSDLGPVTSRLTEYLQADDDFLHMEAKALCEQMVSERTDLHVRIDLPRLVHAHVSLQRRAIHILLNCFASTGWSHRHVQAVLQLAQHDESPSASIQLRKGLSAWRSYDSLYIGFDMVTERAEPETWVWNLYEEARFQIIRKQMHWHFRAVQLSQSVDTVHRNGGLWRLLLPPVSSVQIRCGEPRALRVRPLGLGGSKKLQDVFTDKKIPRLFRSDWPIIYIDDDIAWIPGVVRTEMHTIHPSEARGWVILAHLGRGSCEEMRTLSSNMQRMIRE
ncbi:tRNA lysidine(34) synthetase TilS [Alicyclobacillus dauci]|uniref:tRNA(Ile)-lysidine synthase n=1 Tax=Alicyclobacillus dauci TaxID=1475485 RepID=A0ABY6Z3Z0_9BACL|nr:tRNA lysidine(34) synthetase TilS [Alicyclobacillus dauci]WAH37348.1 tRNA lysidine(34) synthetase TilS [Alicyclobacillus dauci]